MPSEQLAAFICMKCLETVSFLKSCEWDICHILATRGLNSVSEGKRGVESLFPASLATERQGPHRHKPHTGIMEEETKAGESRACSVAVVSRDIGHRWLAVLAPPRLEPAQASCQVYKNGFP